jgi:hypothetical protein
VSALSPAWPLAKVGKCLMAKAKARAIDPEFPVVYISGASAADWPSKGVPNSIMLPKPFAPAQLVTAVSNLLNNRTPTA